MKARSKERMAELLLEELFAQLGEKENIKHMLGDLSSLPVDEVVRKLTGDFEEAIARRRVEALEVVRKKEADAAKKPASEVKSASGGVVPPPTVSPSPSSATPPATVQPGKPDSPVVPVPPQKPKSSQTQMEPPPAAPVGRDTDKPRKPVPNDDAYWGEIEKVLRGGEESVASASHKQEDSGLALRQPDPEDEKAILDAAGAAAGDLVEDDSEEEAVTIAPGSREQRTPAKFADDDVVYIHAVGHIPEAESPAVEPFMLEEKGIDARGFAFACDYEGMRFYLSNILSNVMNISKTGVLLLGKQESLQTRGTHEAILNDLRMHGVLLPFTFGTIARGKDDFQGKVDAHLEDLREALQTIEATKWWTVQLNVLDARMAQLVGTDDQSAARRGRTTERASYTKMPSTKKFDIKLLERILNKEKRIAESVHEELKAAASRADIDMIVGLGSGSSEDWKTILRASYEVKPEGIKRFCRAVTDLQYRHMMFDLMLSVSGDHDAFSLST